MATCIRLGANARLNGGTTTMRRGGAAALGQRLGAAGRRQRWLNAVADRPPVPPLGQAFLASFLISAAAVAAGRRVRRPLGEQPDASSSPARPTGSAAARASSRCPKPARRRRGSANIAFNRMRERLERFIRDRTAMLAAIAHDLRTPITSLRLRAEFIEDEEAKAKILETLAEMQAMAEAVLAFARGDAESEPTRPTDLTALVESIVEDAARADATRASRNPPPVTLTVPPARA